MTRPFHWPSTLPILSIQFAMRMSSTSGGRSITGLEQVVVSSAGFWGGQITFPVWRRGRGADRSTMQLAARSVLALAQGRVNAFLLPVCDRGNTPAYIEGEPKLPPETFDDGSMFDDGSGIVPREVPAHVGGDYEPGATRVIVNMLAGHAPQPGQYFSVGNRLFLIQHSELYGGSLMAPFVPAYWELKVWPPVREAITDGDNVDFDRPHCLVRFATDDTAALIIQHRSISEVTLGFVEAPPLS